MPNNIITWQLNPGLTTYVLLIRQDNPYAGLIYSSSSPYQVTITPANVSSYVIIGTEVGGNGASGIYQASIPSNLPAGYWGIFPRIQVGGSPSLVNDIEGGGVGSLQFNGTNEIFPYTSNPAQLSIAISPIAFGGSGGLPKRNITLNQYSAPAYQYSIVDQNNNPYDMTGHSINFVVFSYNSNGDTEFLFEYSSASNSAGAGSVGISYNNIIVSFDLANTQVPTSGISYVMWDVTVSSQPVAIVGGAITISPCSFSSTQT